VGTIVVGIDGSEGSDAALRWAAAEARLRGGRLRVVHVHQLPQLPLSEVALGATGGMALPASFPENGDEVRKAVESESRRLVDEAIERVGDTSTDGLELERVVLEGQPAPALIDAAKGAELLVLGSRGRGGFLGLLLGSVAQQCVHHPPCPVVVLPPAEVMRGEAQDEDDS
jgi:nucleotide-binding universal stress UspA family protein